MSDTPRTDAFREGAGDDPATKFVLDFMADMEGELTRELAAKTAECEKLKADLEMSNSIAEPHCDHRRDLAQQLAAETAARQAAEARLAKTDSGFGKLAPKGTWLCEVMENIWRAESLEEAKRIGSEAGEQIKDNGLWIGPRALENERDQLRQQVALLRDALSATINSAYPREDEHPTMFKAWQKGLTALAATEPKP